MPLMVDLFCGRGGWTKGFMLHGWECRGYDITPQPEYPGEFVQADVMDLGPEDIADADFICASSPCEQFSVHGLKMFFPKPKWPDVGIKLFEYTRRLCEASGKPFIMENVRCAEQFIGRAVQHCGPFYLWGNAVPAIMPRDLYSIRKGMYLISGDRWRTMTKEQRRMERRNKCGYRYGHASAGRALTTAKLAEVPVELSGYVAQCAAVVV